MRNSAGRCETYRILGIVLMAAGVIVLLFSVPEWLWSSLIGLLLIVLGFLIWRIK